jgi:hypothetical protein
MKDDISHDIAFALAGSAANVRSWLRADVRSRAKPRLLRAQKRTFSWAAGDVRF